LPALIIGRSAPSPLPAGFSGLRLKKMLKNARNRCHATPIVGFSAIVISQPIEMNSLTSATQVGPSLPRAGSRRRRATAGGPGRELEVSLATLKPRIKNPHTSTPRITPSTKYACHIVEPRNLLFGL
jgi:hypothetical protein